ncbi:chalcone isomerase [Parashewanella curva]|uniref:Chalcone isomerase n=1 Tax=Parashewanella curva TaxID=2338552 RepID=A0A3L8PW83_9GAMM|nr:chalcone isomerase family protein [Parashewanella curva]RLV59624.1 chalcone isomerase [Parashewanella curva]
MKIVKLILPLALLAGTFQLQAKTIEGVNVPEQSVIADLNMALKGAGVRSKFFFDLYVGSLYLPSDQPKYSDAFKQGSVAIRLNIISDMITQEKMQDAIAEGFEDATDGKVAPIKAQIDKFMSLFDSGIKVGDQFTFVSNKGQDVVAFKNGKQLADIQNQAFTKALFDIWLGDKPAQRSLKKKMLGK